MKLKIEMQLSCSG